MLDEIFWKLFLMFGMNLNDFLEGAAFVAVLLGLGCIAIYDERTRPRQTSEAGLRLFAILEHSILSIRDWIEHQFMKITPPEIWQTAPNLPSLGRVFLFLLFLPLRVNMLWIRCVLGWMLRRSRRG